MQRLLALVRRIILWQVAMTKCGPKMEKPRGRLSQGAGTCFHGSGAEDSEGTKSLIGVPLK